MATVELRQDPSYPEHVRRAAVLEQAKTIKRST